MKRAIGPLVKEYLSMFPCVAIVGPRQCGKTTFLSELPKSWERFDLEKGSDYDAISRDPDLFLKLNPDHIIIDEAQHLPALFPALRVAIDQKRRKKGRFVLTGSSSPHLVKSLSESLAGRVGVIEMAPFSCSEAYGLRPSPFFEGLKERLSPTELLRGLKPRLTLRQIHAYWWKGGFPEPWLNKSNRFHEVWMGQYIQNHIQRDIARLFPDLNQNRFRIFLGHLSGLSGTILNMSDMARSLGVSSPTIKDYLDIAHGTFLWRNVPSFEKNVLKRVVKHPRGYFRDSGLLHHLLLIPHLSALLRHPKMGHSWEGFVIEHILRQLRFQGIEHRYAYYRTGAGAEVDLILEGTFGLVPIEIKYTTTVSHRALRPLNDFVREHHCPYGIVINNDEKPRAYSEKIFGIPFNHL